MEKTVEFLLIILVVLAGCKTTKQVEKLDASFVEKVQTTQKTESKTTETEKLEQKSAENVTEKDSTLVEETEVYFAAPDSSGKQTIVKIVERTISSGKLREEIKNTETDQSKNKTNNQVSNSSENKQSDSKLESEIKTTKKNLPMWLLLTLGLLVVADAVFWRLGGYGWLKRVTGRLFRHRSI